MRRVFASGREAAVTGVSDLIRKCSLRMSRPFKRELQNLQS